MDNLTLKIDPATHDLVLDDGGNFMMISDRETVVQCIRLTLETFKKSWFLNLEHGTDYDAAIENFDDTEEVIREAIYQETEVAHIDALEVSKEERTIKVFFSGRLQDGTVIEEEVIL